MLQSIMPCPLQVHQADAHRRHRRQCTAATPSPCGPVDRKTGNKAHGAHLLYVEQALQICNLLCTPIVICCKHSCQAMVFITYSGIVIATLQVGCSTAKVSAATGNLQISSRNCTHPSTGTLPLTAAAPSGQPNPAASIPAAAPQNSTANVCIGCIHGDTRKRVSAAAALNFPQTAIGERLCLTRHWQRRAAPSSKQRPRCMASMHQ